MRSARVHFGGEAADRSVRLRLDRGSEDAFRPWATFSEINKLHGLTRGALDALVLRGLVPWALSEEVVLARLSEEQWTAFHQWDAAQEAAKRLGSAAVRPTRSEMLDEAARACGLPLGQQVYDVTQWLARDAVGMLLPAVTEAQLEELEAAGRHDEAAALAQRLSERTLLDLGAGVRQRDELTRCLHCGAEIPMLLVKVVDSRVRCPVCLAAELASKQA